jgi:hypothetical protein
MALLCSPLPPAALFVHLWNSGKADDESALIARPVSSHWRALARDLAGRCRVERSPYGQTVVPAGAQAPLVQDFAEQGFPLVGGASTTSARSACRFSSTVTGGT